MNWLHARGLKAGIYTDAGVYDSADCGLASGGGYYQQDADQFAAWGIDAIKVDFLCGIAEDMAPGPAFAQFSQAVAQSGRHMLLNLCNPLTSAWGEPNPPADDAFYNYAFGPTIADSWRTDTDIAFGTPTAGEFANVVRNIDDNEAHPEAQSPGHYNDPDYLLPMRPLSGGGYELDETQSISQFEMWAEMGSPLMLGSDPRTLPQSMLDVLDEPRDPGRGPGPAGRPGRRDRLHCERHRVQQGAVGQRSARRRAPQHLGLAAEHDRSVRRRRPVRRRFGARPARPGRPSARSPARTPRPCRPTAPRCWHWAAPTRFPAASLGGDATGDPALVHVNDADSAAFVRGAEAGSRNRPRRPRAPGPVPGLNYPAPPTAARSAAA